MKEVTYQGFAALEAKSDLSPFAYLPAELEPFDIEIEISHCGICYSDAHLIDNDWRKSVYPFIPGHEIIGQVRALGSAVTHFKVGDRVGVGWQRSACLNCEFCLAGNENLCAAQTATCIGHHGGFADFVRTDSRFAFVIPKNLSSATTAPLLCGGATVFAPIARYGIHAKSKVGVIGIGGLGHMALLFLRALQAEITAFSSSPSKKDEAIQMGAHHFASSIDPKEILKHASKFDLLLCTVHAKLDWLSFLQTVKPGGVFCLVGAAPGLMQIPPGLLVGAQKTISGSDIANRKTIIQMLEFAEKHQIAPVVETLPMKEVNQGVRKLRENQVRYRMVMENPR
jgi:uncharacterized zinc-type alcohol dehydrogenase-like protein